MVRKPSTAIAVPPPSQASKAPASTGASGITDIETNCDVDWIRPWSLSGVTANR
jgi:hypothetical protein